MFPSPKAAHAQHPVQPVAYPVHRPPVVAALRNPAVPFLCVVYKACLMALKKLSTGLNKNSYELSSKNRPEN